MNEQTSSLPVVVIGAGPVGLAAAAHLVSKGEQPLVLEAGDSVGASVRSWGHVRFFSPWQYVVDSVAVALLEAAGWRMPMANALPTGDELVAQYLRPLAALPQLAPTIQLGTRVLAVTRQGFDKMKTAGRAEAPFAVRVRRADGSEGQFLARAVLDASGTYTSPNPLGGSGIPAVGEAALRDLIFAGIPDVLGRDRARYAGRRVLVVGSGHSAFNVLGDLATLAKQAPATEITWAIRRGSAQQLYGGGAADELPARAELGNRMHQLVGEGVVQLVTGVKIAALRRTAAGIEVISGQGRLPLVDEIVATTGFRPDLSLTRELRLALDPAVESPVALASLIDPNVHSCGTVPPHGFQELSHPEPNFFTVGMKSYGRAPTFLLLTGYEQVRSVVAQLVGDYAAAARVELVLPATGVCSGPAENADDSCCGAAPAFVDVSSIAELPTGNVASGCCGGPAPATSGACCAQDAEAKAAGQSGCGCGEAQSSRVSAPATAGAR